jgi:hypothetical protein
VAPLADPEDDLHPARKRYMEILAARGAMGASRKHLLERLEGEGLGVRPETLSRWFRKDEVAGRVHQADYNRWKIGPAPAGTASPDRQDED